MHASIDNNEKLLEGRINENTLQQYVVTMLKHLPANVFFLAE